MEQIPPTLIQIGGPAGLLGLLIWAVIKEWIVLGPAHQREIGVKDQIIATQAKTIEVKDAQLEKLAIVGETTVRILASVESLARERSS